MQLGPVPSGGSSRAVAAAGVGAPSRLQKLAPAGASLDDLAPFYALGEKLSDEKLASSLEWVNGALRTERGHLGKESVPDRIEILLTLLKAHPAPRGMGIEQRFPGGELSQLVKERDRFLDGHAECRLGQNLYQVPLTQPRRPASLAQLCKDYASALESIRRAPGRIAREMQPDDPEWALDCVRIEHCHLHREPSRMALFRRLVGTFQDPAIAHVVMSEMETLPLDRREGYLATLQGALSALGPHESDWEKTRAEGDRVKGLAAGVQLVMKVARGSDVPGALLSELRGLGSVDLDDAERGAHWRGPGQSWAQGIANDPQTQLPAEKDRRLAEAVLKRSVDRGEDHGLLLSEVRSLGFRLHEGEYLSVFLQALEQDEPLQEAMPRMVREYELTNSTRGLSPIRAQVAEALASGALKGDLDMLMKRFELIYVHRTSGGEPKDKALTTSLAELMEVSAPGKTGVRQTENAVWVGGVRVRKASNPTS